MVQLYDFTRNKLSFHNDLLILRVKISSDRFQISLGFTEAFNAPIQCFNVCFPYV